MKIPRIEITPSRFYTIGKYMFFISGLIGLIRLLDLWSTFKSYDVFSSIASTIFAFTLSAFFAHLQGKENIREVDDGDIFEMNKALENLNLEKTHGKKK